MANVLFKKSLSLPTTFTPNTVYLIPSQADPNYLDIYVSNASGTSAKKIVTKDDINNIISQLSSALAFLIVADITERNALTLSENKLILVVDASADPTVNTGSALYAWKNDTSEWFKISENESLDVTLDWNSIQGRPTSTPAQIDQAVADSHTHANKAQLDKISEDVNGEFLYNGDYPLARLSASEW